MVPLDAWASAQWCCQAFQPHPSLLLAGSAGSFQPPPHPPLLLAGTPTGNPLGRHPAGTHSLLTRLAVPCHWARPSCRQLPPMAPEAKPLWFCFGSSHTSLPYPRGCWTSFSIRLLVFDPYSSRRNRLAWILLGFCRFGCVPTGTLVPLVAWASAQWCCQAFAAPSIFAFSGFEGAKRHRLCRPNGNPFGMNLAGVLPFRLRAHRWQRLCRPNGTPLGLNPAGALPFRLRAHRYYGTTRCLG